jgi:hypothetical protein
MRVKFKKGDPRAGQIAELPDDQAQRLIDAGTATKAADDAENTPDPNAATGSYGTGVKQQTDTTANKAAADTTANKAAKG